MVHEPFNPQSKIANRQTLGWHGLAQPGRGYGVEWHMPKKSTIDNAENEPKQSHGCKDSSALLASTYEPELRRKALKKIPNEPIYVANKVNTYLPLSSESSFQVWGAR